MFDVHQFGDTSSTRRHRERDWLSKTIFKRTARMARRSLAVRCSTCSGTQIAHDLTQSSSKNAPNKSFSADLVRRALFASEAPTYLKISPIVIWSCRLPVIVSTVHMLWTEGILLTGTHHVSTYDTCHSNLTCYLLAISLARLLLEISLSVRNKVSESRTDLEPCFAETCHPYVHPHIPHRAVTVARGS